MKEAILIASLLGAAALPSVQSEGVAMPEQLAWADVKIPANVECKIVNGQQVCTVRTRTVERTVQPIATRAADCKCVDCTCAAVAGVALDRECEPRFNGPVARSVRASGNVARAVGWRITHPFGGRFRR